VIYLLIFKKGNSYFYDFNNSFRKDTRCKRQRKLCTTAATKVEKEKENETFALFNRLKRDVQKNMLIS
jgi:hypothetical protein